MQKRCFVLLIGVLLGDIVHSIIPVKLLQTIPVNAGEIESQLGLWTGKGEEFVAEENIYQMLVEDGAAGLHQLILEHCKLKEENDPPTGGVLVAFIDGEWELLDNFALEMSWVEQTDGKKESKIASEKIPKETAHEVEEEKTDPSKKSLLCITYLNRNRLNQNDILYRVSWPLLPKATLNIEISGQIHYFTIRLPNIRKAFGSSKTQRKCPLIGPPRVLAPRQHRQFYRNSGQRANEQRHENGKLMKTAKELFDLLARFPLKPSSPTETIPEEDRYTFVLVDDAMRFSHTGKGQLDSLSKHCIHAFIAEYVYCAGELKVTVEGGEKVLHLLNNSGSYKAKPLRMKILKELLIDNFPGFNDGNLVIDLHPDTTYSPSPLLEFIYDHNTIIEPLSLDAI